MNKPRLGSCSARSARSARLTALPRRIKLQKGKRTEKMTHSDYKQMISLSSSPWRSSPRAQAMAFSSPFRISPLPTPSSSSKPGLLFLPKTPSISLLRSSNLNFSSSLTTSTNDGNGGFGKGGGRGRGGGCGGGESGGDSNRKSSSSIPVALFIEGWRSRVAADPEFPFKVLMEELVGVSATAVGDMATRPNFGLDQLDFVLSTIVVGSIVNFTLMYLLAPTATTITSSSSSLPSYIFEPGPYSLATRTATFIYKGIIFAAVGFASGLAGTAISNGLVSLREGKGGNQGDKKKKKGPKTVLNAATWAVHMGVSSNLRYQTLNGLEFLMAKGMPAGLFKMVVVVLRCLNNVAGGMSFVILGRLMGSQKE